MKIIKRMIERGSQSTPSDITLNPTTNITVMSTVEILHFVFMS